MHNRGGIHLLGMPEEKHVVPRLQDEDEGRLPEIPPLEATWYRSREKLIYASGKPA